MDLVLNGVVTINGVEFWRIENLDEGLVGLEALRKPWALVRDKKFAEHIVATQEQ